LPLSRTAPAAIVLVALMALAGFAVYPIVTSLAVRFAVDEEIGEIDTGGSRREQRSAQSRASAPR
jgi:hypothetical protein